MAIEFHRLETPTYMGGLPATHDYINNTPGGGSQAPVDAAKSGGHAQDGTFFIAFGEDALSSYGNRAHGALSTNTDWLDDIVSGELAVPAETSDTASGAVLSVQLSGDIFVGRQTEYLDTQIWRDKLCKVVDAVTGNELLTSTDLPIKVIKITSDAGGLTNVVGVPATGFSTNPYVFFTSPGIQDTQNYTLRYAERGSLKAAVPDKTYLDMLTRFATAGAPEVCGEVERFMHSASRRTGTAVNALAASILETPGYGDNILGKSESITFDVDPDNTAGSGARGVAIRLDREGSPISLLSIAEDSKGGDIVEFVTDRDSMTFEDALMTAANGGMPLSDADNDVFRVGEFNLGAQPSLLRMINNRVFITCGDGSVSWGDFSGSDALQNALQQGLSSGVSCHILLKRGAYTMDSVDIATNNGTIIIEGENRYNTKIDNNDTGTGYSLAVTGTGNNVTFKNVQFTQNSTAGVAVQSTNANYLSFEDCLFLDQVVKWGVDRDINALFGNNSNGSVHFRMTRCRMQSTFEAPLLDFVFDDAVAAPQVGTILIEDCYLNPPEENYPPCRITNSDIAGAGAVRKLLFNRCEILLGGNDTSTGDFSANTGALELVAGTTVFLTVEEVEWRDCHVESGGSGYDNCPLLYLPTANSGGGSVTVGSIKIIGGSWLIQEATALSPFYIGGEKYDDQAAVVEVHLESVLLGFENYTSNSNGAPPAEVQNGGLPVTADWAAIFIQCQNIVMKNVEWQYSGILSDSGDLWLARCRQFRIDGIYMASFAAGGGGASPAYRAKFEGTNFTHQFSSGEIANVHISGIVSNTEVAATEGIVVPIPNNGSLSARQNPMIMRNFRISHFLGAGINGFYMLGDSDGHTNGLHLIDCHVYKVGADGFYLGYDTGDAPIQNLVIDKCEFDSCGQYGLQIDTGAADFGEVSITNCLFKESYNYGIYVNAGSWNALYGGLLVMHNRFRDNKNNGVLTDGLQSVQVSITNGDTAVGAAYGNISLADIGVTGLFGQFGLVSGPSDDFRGTETGYSYQNDGGGGGVGMTPDNAQTTTGNVADRRHHDGGDLMIHNVMRLVL